MPPRTVVDVMIILTIDPVDLRTVHVMPYRNPEGRPGLGWFFATAHWRGGPVNAEPPRSS